VNTLVRRLGMAAAFATLAWPLVAAAAPADNEPAPGREPTILEDPLTPLVPERPAGEFDFDRVKAASLYAHGRMLLQRERYAEALARYQRAYRYDPSAVSILREIVPLAFELKRPAEAARYAVIAAEKDPQDPLLLQQLAIYLTQEGDFDRALHLYEKALQLRQGAPLDGRAVLLRSEMGRLQFLEGQFDRAAESFAVLRDALADPKKFGLPDAAVASLKTQVDVTYALMGEAFLESGRLDEAEQAFRKSNEAKPVKGLLGYRLAKVEARRGNHDEGLKKLDEYFQAKLSNAGTEPYKVLGDLLKKKLGDADRAEKETIARLAKMAEEDASNAPLAYELADRYLAAGKFAEAETTYLAAVNLEATIDGYRGLVKVYRRAENIDGLLSTLGQVVIEAESIDRLGEEAESLKQDKTLAARLVEAARKKGKADPDLEPLAPGAAVAAAELAIAKEDFDAADELYELALKSPRPARASVVLRWGLALFTSEQFERAARVFRRAIDEKVQPENNAAFHYYLSGALEFAGKTDEALAAAERAVAERPDSVPFRGRAAWILLHAKRHDEAEKRYLELLEKYGKDYTSQGVRETIREARLGLSNLCVMQNRIPEAEEWLELVLDEFPEDVGAMNDLGYLWSDQNKHLAKSHAMAKAAVAAEPENVAFRDTLGWVLFRLGRYEEAVAELKAAVELSEDDADGVILDHLGDAHSRLNDGAAALAAWRKAVESFKEAGEADKIPAIEEKIRRHNAPSKR
jgi:tetratricopeptide (TPR) repeat protein